LLNAASNTLFTAAAEQAAHCSMSLNAAITLNRALITLYTRRCAAGTEQAAHCSMSLNAAITLNRALITLMYKALCCRNTRAALSTNVCARKTALIAADVASCIAIAN
jgi:hypothetical protein